MSMPPPPGDNQPPPYPYQPGQQPSYPQPGYQPPGFQQPGFQQPGHQAPIGYQPYGMPPAATPQGTNGLSIASLVLSLVSIIPCFWFLPIPAVLAVVFGLISRNQIKTNPGQGGKGLAIAGLIIGLIFVAVSVAVWVVIATGDGCVRDGSSFHCSS